MRPSRFWLFVVLALGLIMVFVAPAIRHALEPGHTDVDLKSLGFFHFDSRVGGDIDVPARWRRFDGKRVWLEGFMYDSRSAMVTRDFEVMHNLTHPGLHGPPLVRERVFATVPNGAVPFYKDLVRIQGTLHVKVVNPTRDLVTTVYQLDVDDVRPEGRIPVVSAVLTSIAIIVVLFLICFLVVLSIRTWNRHKRLRTAERLCPICGYDLRASGNRCPECGTLVDIVRPIAHSVSAI